MVFAWRVKSFLLTRTNHTGSAAASLAIEVEAFGVQPLLGLVGPWPWTLQSSVGDFQDILSLGSQRSVELGSLEGAFDGVCSGPWIAFLRFFCPCQDEFHCVSACTECPLRSVRLALVEVTGEVVGVWRRDLFAFTLSKVRAVSISDPSASPVFGGGEVISYLFVEVAPVLPKPISLCKAPLRFGSGSVARMRENFKVVR